MLKYHAVLQKYVNYYILIKISKIHINDLLFKTAIHNIDTLTLNHLSSIV